jgi:hypothetical protein
MPEKFVAGGQIIFNDDMSDDVNIIVEIVHEKLIGIHFTFVNNDAVGELSACASNINQVDDLNSVPIVFKDGTNKINVTAGDSLPKYMDLNTSAPYVIVKYKRTSGTVGNIMNAYTHAKAG